MIPIDLTNNFRLIGTIVTPFEKSERSGYEIFTTKIECVNAFTTKSQVIPIVFFDRKGKYFNLKKDIRGKQVVVEGLIQGRQYQTDYGIADSITLVCKKIAVLSDMKDEKIEECSALGNIVYENELPF